MSRNMDKKVKQKQAGRRDEYVQKTKQVKESATGILDAPKSARHKRETRFALREGKCQITR